MAMPKGMISPVSPLVRANAALATVGLSVACFAMLLLRQEVAGETRFMFMLWNLFLAWLPYAAAVAAGLLARWFPKGGAARDVATIPIAVVWLLFLPNCVYLTTDFIHPIAIRHLYVDQGAFGYLVWYDIVLFFLFAWCGIILGYLSTYQFHQLASRRFGRTAGWGFVGAVSLLAGYGIFLGRIVRLNSWDAWLRPEELLIEVLDNLHWRGVAFSLLFGFFIAAIYVTLYHLQQGKR